MTIARSTPITYREVLRLAVPMMFAYLSTALVGTVSTAAIGRLGIAYLSAAIAIAAILFDVLFVSLNFLRSTTLGLTALALGAGYPEAARAILQRSLLLSLGLGVLILLLREPEARIGLVMLGAHGPILQAAANYTLIRALSAPFALGNYTILGTLLGRGRRRGCCLRRRHVLAAVDVRPAPRRPAGRAARR
jgi:MATE family multidrug resistance protein